jgi:two-component system sensor histidine kinase BaeS
MRLRVIHKLALLMLSYALVSVLALGGYTAWNLRNGFTEFLNQRDQQFLDHFSEALERAIAQTGRVDWSILQHEDVAKLIRQVARLSDGSGFVAAPPPRGAPVRQLGAPPPPDTQSPPAGSPGRPPRIDGVTFPGMGAPDPAKPQRLQGIASDLLSRLAVLDNDSNVLYGEVRNSRAAVFTMRPVVQGGEVVLNLRRYRAEFIDDAAAGFLADQYRGLFWTSIALVALALVSAVAVSRTWAKPLISIKRATNRLALGEFDVRLPQPERSVFGTDEVGEVMRNVNHMAQSLEQLDGSRRRWLADIAHELRTPLTILQGNIEAICDGVHPLEMAEVLVLHEEVSRLTQLVHDLHLLATSQLQEIPCLFTETEAVSLARHCVQTVQRRAGKKGMALVFNKPDAPQIKVTWDAMRIEQMFRNILENSVRYTYAPGQIVVSMVQQDDHLVIEFNDTAPGVSAHDLPHLFEPMFRTDPASQSDRYGSGLGLAICESIAHAHGGDIRASQSALGGLCIRIELPLVAGKIA